MKKSLLVFILVLASVSDSFANTCSYLFGKKPIEFIEEVNNTHNGKLSNDAPVEYQIQNLKNRQRKKAQRLLDRVLKGDVASAKDLESIALELTVLFYGRRDTIDRFILKSKSERDSESFRLRVKKQLLEKGLKSFVATQPKDLQISLWIKIKKNVRRLYQSQALNWLQIPFGLPLFRDNAIPEGLLMSVIWDGVPKHQAAVDAFMAKQQKWEVYAPTRRLYMAVVLGMLSIHGYQEGVKKEELDQKQKVEQVVTALEKTQELPEMARQYKEDLKEQGLKDSIEDFKSQIKRDPTPEEIAEMRAIIYEE